MLGVFTGADCAADGLGAIPHDPLPKTRDDMKLTAPGGGEIFIGPHLLLPADKVRHVGEAVAMVVAETKAQALDAAEALDVVYDELPFVLHSEDAMKPGAPAVWDEVPDNILVDTSFGDAAATDRAFAQAAHVVAMDFNIGRVTGVPLGAARLRRQLRRGERPLHAARRQRRRGAAEARARQHARHRARNACASCRSTSAAISARATASIRNTAWCCGPRASSAARSSITATRSECFISDYQGRDLVSKLELALDAKGRFLALRATNISNAGARCVSLSPLSARAPA